MTFARLFVAATMATTLAATLAPASAAPKPTPTPAGHYPAIPLPKLPTKPLHAEYVVEVNKHGQVVKIKSASATTNSTFNTQTFGNAQQMWIRRPDGTAVVGLFKVTYDYNPSTQKIARHVSFVSAGGDWGDAEGAANVMIDAARKAAQAQAAAQAANQAKERANLPSFNQITGKPTPTPHPTPTI